jgi:hypothetical protein
VLTVQGKLSDGVNVVIQLFVSGTLCSSRLLCNHLLIMNKQQSCYISEFITHFIAEPISSSKYSL